MTTTSEPVRTVTYFVRTLSRVPTGRYDVWRDVTVRDKGVGSYREVAEKAFFRQVAKGYADTSILEVRLDVEYRYSAPRSGQARARGPSILSYKRDE